VKQETFFAMFQYIVDDLLIQFGTQGNSSQRLSFTTSEDCRTVRSGQVADFAPDRADFVSLTSVKALAFVQDATAHSLFLYIMVVTVDQCCFFAQFFFAELCFEFFADSIESVHAFVLIFVAGSCDGISLCVASIMNGFTQFFIIYFVAIFAFYGRTHCFCQFFLSLTLYFDCFVSCFHGVQQVKFGNFTHFTFYHHDVFISGTYHKVHVCFFQLIESRVDNEFSVDACYTYFGNRSVERNI